MASSNETIEKSALHDWVEQETRPLDLVASWESLCVTYKTLEFTDPISDTTKMEEFKWIIKEINKHLTRARKTLLTCRDIDSIRQTLLNMFSPTGSASITNRSDLAYHKLKQQWINQMLLQLQMMEEQTTEEEMENGEPGF